jgi:hypothetical protein
MKLKILTFLTLVIISSCNAPDRIDYSTIQNIKDINDNVIKDFYKQAIDSIVGNCHLKSKPITKINLDPLKRHFPVIFENNDSFFQEQVDKFNDFNWETVVGKNRTITEPEFDSISKKGLIGKGWKYFQEDFNGKCICSISIPLFTKDFNKIYLDYEIYNEFWGKRQILEYELKENEWIIIDWD